MALLLVDVVNPFDYEASEALLVQARAIVAPVQRLAERARVAGVPVIYANDNFGRWRSSFSDTVERCLAGPGGDVARALHPCRDDYFVLKPHRSGFYATPLEILLRGLGVARLVLCGITTDMCVLATASDACMRGFSVQVPRDGTATFDDDRRNRTLRLLREAFDADTAPAAAVDWRVAGDR